MKPNTYYYTLDGGKTYHEGHAPRERMNTAQHVRTDEKGEIIYFQKVGEVFAYKDEK